MVLNDTETVKAQRQVCEQHGAPFDPAAPDTKVGIALNVRDGLMPINGLRHPQREDANGWYIWAGEVLSSEDDFFKPLHIEHIPGWCPQVKKFLALPPGWRFLIAGNYEDVWFDETLLAID